LNELVRPDLRVVARILGALWEHQRPLRPTQLQQAARTNYTQFSRYLELLAERGLVTVGTDAEGDTWVELTAKGYEAHQFLLKGIRDLLANGKE
jgi:predicted transcriptional regulator